MTLYRDYHPNTAKKCAVPAAQNNILYRSAKIKLRLIKCIESIIDWLLIFFA
jgi:hypothetical protein